MSLEGQLLGEFEILERLGEGGMGCVYKARQTSLDRIVAIKTLHSELGRDKNYIARFRQEAKAAALLNHPNLVKVYSAGETEGVHWFAMEYVEGESVKALLKRKGRLNSKDAIGIALHVTTALEHAWRKAALIHRDIKPDNIFLSSEGEVKLGDLGLAKSLKTNQEVTMAGVSMGTPSYMSPEQVEGKREIDFRTDIYSLGCTLYHLLGGQAPYSAESAVGVMMKHVHSPPPDLRGIWPECPPAVAAAVLKMVQKEPANRQQSYEEVSDDLRRAYEAIDNERSASPLEATQLSASARKKTGSAAAKWVGIALMLCAIAGMLFIFAPRKGLTSAQEVVESPQGTAATATKEAPFVNSLGMKFVPVPIVGGPTNGQRVLFSVWETRVKDYEAFAKDTGRPSPKPPFPQGPRHPVVKVSCDEADLFCKWLTARDQAAGRLPADLSYRLPSEYEWKCAADIGASEDAANPVEKTDESGTPGDGAGSGKTAPVGALGANRFGLFDLGGNVFQWCEDPNDKGAKMRVLRGSSWLKPDRKKSSGHSLSGRYLRPPGFRSARDGFRCVVAVSSQ